MTSSGSQINEPQRGCPKRAELPDLNINTGAQSATNFNLNKLRLRSNLFYSQQRNEERIEETAA